MKKRYFSSILLAMLVASGHAQSTALGNQLTAQERGKLNIALLARVNDLSIQHAAALRARAKAGTLAPPSGSEAKASPSGGGAVASHAGLQEAALEEPRISILVEVAPDADPVSVLQQHGVEATAHVYQYASARVALSQLQQMAADAQVVRMELPGKVRPMLYHAHADTGVNRIHAGEDEDIHTPYTGKGVLALVEDSGFQPGHQMLLDEDGNSKVELLVEEDGTRHTEAADIKAYQDVEECHGTHVVSILAGSKVTAANQKEYVGVAPGARLALFYTPATSDESLLAPLQRLEEYASGTADDGRPKVLSFSVGGNATALSDGNSIPTSILAKMGEKWPICVAAGNEGAFPHMLLYECSDVEKTVTACPESYDAVRYPTSGSYDFASDQGSFYMSIRLENLLTGEVYAQYDVNEAQEGKVTCLSSLSEDDDDDVLRNEAFTKYHPEASVSWLWKDDAQGRHCVIVNLDNVHVISDVCTVTFVLRGGKVGQVIRGSGDEGLNTYLRQSPSPSTGIALTADGAINDWALAQHVIPVGSYNTHVTGNAPTDGKQGYVSRFSSYMTHTPGNRLLPYICAPGAKITAAFNRWYQNGAEGETTYQIVGGSDQLIGMEGTSMATPYMAGVIALWLEANPQLTPSDIKDIIAQTARQDKYVRSEPETARWGHGKVDAYAGLKEALNRSATSLGTISQDKDFLWRKRGNQLEAYVAGETALTARLINMEGKVVAEARQSGNTVTLSAPQAAPGVYVLQVQGLGQGTSHKAKVVMR